MKYVIVLASGLGDEPMEELSGRTPVEAAHTPALDELARTGKSGTAKTLPDDLPASEEVALLSALGYDPHRYFAGEAGLAAAGIGEQVGEDRLALMHNLATEADGVLEDHAAGQISPPEAEGLLKSLHGALARPDVEFHVCRGFAGVTVIPAVRGPYPTCTPTDAMIGRPVADSLPLGEGAELVRRVIWLSREVFREHDINRVRTDLGENPANLLWLWGPGRQAELPPFESGHRLRAAMVAAAESARGLGHLAGMVVADVQGATGGYTTDYAAKAQAALDLLDDLDLVVVHAASPAEASLEGNVSRKINAIQDIDALITAPLLRHAQEAGDVRMMFMATHVASTSRRTRTHAQAPLAMYGPGLDPVREGDFSEAAAAQGETCVAHGHELLEYFLTR